VKFKESSLAFFAVQHNDKFVLTRHKKKMSICWSFWKGGAAEEAEICKEEPHILCQRDPAFLQKSTKCPSKSLTFLKKSRTFLQ